MPSLPVVSTVQPNYLRELLPSTAPEDPEPFDTIREDVHSKIMPGLTHWSHPGFMAFFPSLGSYPGAIAEMYSNAFNGAHFNWICSPAVTELETIVLDWTAQALGLPEEFLSTGPTHGGGVIHGTASEAILTVMVAARDKYLAKKTAHITGDQAKEDEEWRIRSTLVAVGSSGTHSATKKAAQILGVRFATVPVTKEDGYSMRGDALAHTLDELAGRGLEPFYLTATLGTTEVCAVDDAASIADTLAARNSDIFVHVDAAFAGTALLLPEYKSLAASFGRFDSFNFNPHKWMLTNFDCSVTFVRRRADLVTSSLSIKPPFLRNHYSDKELVTDFRDWQIGLGRRFRSLKLWFVLRSYGLSGLRSHVRKGIALAEELEKKLRSREDLFTVFTAARFALVTLRVNADTEEETNRRTEEVYDKINAGGKFYLTSTVVSGSFAIRVCTGVAAVQEEHVQGVFEALVAAAS